MKRTEVERKRFILLAVGMMVFFVLVAARLGQLQIVNGTKYREIVDRQSSGKVPIPGERGVIYDRHGRQVAKNVKLSSLYAYPESKAELREAAKYIESAFGLKSGTATKKYRLEVRRFRWVHRFIDDALAARIEKDAPAGLHLRDETVREYPFGVVGKQVLGFTNIDNQGIAGIELSMDTLLSGQKGWADIRRDGLRNLYKVREKALVKPVSGRSQVLTLDWELQAIVQEELNHAVEEYNAEFGMAAFVECATGDVLAMAHCDPEDQHPERPSKLCPVSDQFEPGSIFKAFTAAAILDAGIVKYDDTIFCEEGVWQIGRRRLHDDKELGWLTFREIIELSSNIGLGKLAIQLEGDEMIDTYRKFGFGERFDCGLPGEIDGSLKAPSAWSDYNIAALAMGHSIAVTSLQMTMAMNAIANGGELLRPHVILGEVDSDGRVTRLAQREVINRPLKEETADTLASFLRGVVERGTATMVNSQLVSIAGKTGTAELPNLERGGYYKNRFMASFAGFFPAEKPIVCGIVILKNPQPIHYGGYTSGKAFRKIAERYWATNPDAFSRPEFTLVENARRLEMTVKSPELVGRTYEQAKALVEHRGLKLRADNTDGVVAWQFPPADRQILSGDEVVVGLVPQGENEPRMIDLRGLTIRRASAFLNQAGIKFRVRGTGKVRQQSIKAGQTIPAGAVCALTCRES